MKNKINITYIIGKYLVIYNEINRSTKLGVSGGRERTTMINEHTKVEVTKLQKLDQVHFSPLSWRVG